MIEKVQVPGHGEYISPLGVFIVKKTSNRYSEDPVIEGAFKGLVLNKDQRCLKSPDDNPHVKKTWYSPQCFGHGVNETGIFRYSIVECDDWLIEMGWDDVESFVRRHGDCVIGIDSAGYSWIEIYDDYRE